MNPVNKILGKDVSYDKELNTWVVEFEGGYVEEVVTDEGNRNKIMIMARDQLSKANRYNFEARRASGGRILKVYPKRR